VTDPRQNFTDTLRLLVPINGLPPPYQDQLFKEAQIIKLKKKENVFVQGSRDDFSYYLLEGTIEMYANDQFIKQVEGGTGAAFHPLAQLQPRQMTARAKTPVTVLRVNRILMDRLLSLGHEPPAATGGIEAAEISGEGGEDWMTILLQSELFMRIPPSNIQRLLATMQSVEFKAGDVVVRQDDPGDFYYIVKSGRCEVCRKTSRGASEIRLAELGPGASFGEEALVSGAKRNATVRMLTDGELARLTKEDFIELIKKPLLKTLSFEQAQAQVQEGGGVWLDVRFPEEYQHGHFPGSVNIPLNILRNQADKLDGSKSYVAYCDTGSRSSVAAFLLTQRGLDAAYLEGGCLRHLTPPPPQPAPPPSKTATRAATAAKTTPPAAKTVPKPEPTASPSPPPPAVVRQAAASVEAEVRASALRAEVAKASLQLEEAQRLKVEATRQAAAEETAQQAMLRAERERAEAEARRAAEIMAETKRLKEQLEREKQQAEAEAERLRREHEAKLQQLKAAAEDRLRAEEARLQELYRAKAEEIEALQKQKKQAETMLEKDRKKLAEETSEARKALAAVKKQLEAQQKQELKFRETLQAQLAEERRKLETEFARNHAMLELVRQEKKAAEAAREAAAHEAEVIIEEYKSKFERMRAEEEARMATERRALEAERERLKQAAEAAAKMRADAETAQRAAAARAAQLREQRDKADEATAARLRAEIEENEAREAAAGERLREAIINEETLLAERLENEKNFQMSSERNKEILRKLEEELKEWAEEQDRRESSTVGRDTLTRMQQHVARINEKAQQAKKESQSHDENLLKELASVMSDGD